MKTKQLTRLWSLMLLLMAMLVPGMAWADITPTQPTVGDGSAENPYQISTAAELYWFKEKCNEYYNENYENATYCAKLTADIVVNDGTFDADGNFTASGASETSTPESWSWTTCYSGTFDGNGHTISGLYNNSGNNCSAFCGDLNNGGTIKNLGIINSYFKGGYWSGIICGQNNYGTISNCYTHSSTVSGSSWVGCICGQNSFGTISGCYSVSTASGSNFVGNICGMNAGTVTNCYTNQSTGKGGGTQVSDDDFTSGEVAYLLNDGIWDGTQAWYQALGTDSYPVLTYNGSNALKLSDDGTSYVNCVNHTHSLTKVEAVAATSTSHGCKEYYTCSGCDKLFADAEGTTVVTLDELVIHYFTEIQAGITKCTSCGTYQYQSPTTDFDGTYLIANAGQLISFANMVNEAYQAYEDSYGENMLESYSAKLTADITLNDGTFSADGTFTATGATESSEPMRWPVIKYFSGVTFDGQGHVVSGLYAISQECKCHVGLIGNMDEGAVLKNVGLVNSYFDGVGNGYSSYVGLCGAAFNSTISNCYSDIIATTMNRAGGIAGNAYESTITNCYSTSSLTAEQVGGIVGNAYASTITNCYTTYSSIGPNDNGTHCEANVTAERLASGEIAYLLNGSVDDAGDWTEGTTDGTQTWYQAIGSDASPVLVGTGSNTVYQGSVNGGNFYVNENGTLATLDIQDGYEFASPVAFTVGTATYNRTMTNQWGTLCLPMSLTVDDSNCEYFTLESAANDEITLSKITDSTIPAGMPVIVRCTSVESGISFAESDVEICTAPAEGSSTDGLTLTGTFTEKDVTGQSGYYFADDSFCNIGDNEVIIAPFRAYLAGTISGDAGQLAIRTFDDTATAIDMLNATDGDGASAVYDLQGRKLKSLQQGVNIVKMSNGQTKKVIIK